ncbi:cholesteryl ester transfer protein isoform X2 [Chiloscyllium punctatum]|uniref:cholesteryl ester transfer protein isoform X2 n=1 Tax=Chiloscyllium punctatum TaxID=137246 RepID=UPI003B63E302
MFLWVQLSPVFAFLAAVSTSYDPASTIPNTGIVCRFTKEAGLVFNQETSDVIQATFRHASFPDIEGETSILLLGSVSYSFKNLQINNMSVERSDVDLSNEKGILIAIQDVAAAFEGTMEYAYSNWLLHLNHSLEFEIHSQTDVNLAVMLAYDNGRFAVTIPDCQLNFDKLTLKIQRDKEANWIQKLFTDFVSFTLRHIVKGQICAEIHKMANLLADFTLDQAGLFVQDGEIATSVKLTSDPVLTSGYIESRHEGSVSYKNSTVFQKPSAIPVERREIRMFNLWVSEPVINSLLFAAHHDNRLTLILSDGHLLKLFEDGGSKIESNLLQQDSETIVHTSYADSKIHLRPSSHHWSIKVVRSNPAIALDESKVKHYLEAFFAAGGLEKIISYIEFYITALLHKKGLRYFNITNSVMETYEGYVTIGTDFGFPRQLLENFLRNLAPIIRT